MSERRLRYTVVVRHPDTLAATALQAGESLPEWASDLVQTDDLESARDSAKPAEKAAAKRSK